MTQAQEIKINPEYWGFNFDTDHNVRIAINDRWLILLNHENVDTALEHFETGKGSVRMHHLATPEWEDIDYFEEEEDEYGYEFSPRQTNDPLVEPVGSVSQGEVEAVVQFEDKQGREVFLSSLYSSHYLEYIYY